MASKILLLLLATPLLLCGQLSDPNFIASLKPAAASGGGGGGGSISFVQAVSSGNNTASDSATLAYSSDVTSGNMLVICGSLWKEVTAPTSVTISKSSGTATIGTVTVDVGNVPSGMTWRTYIAYVQVTGSGSLTLSINPSGTSDSYSWTQAEFAGVTQLDVDGGQTDASAANPSDSITTSAADTVIIAVMSHDGTTTALSENTGWTLTGENETNSGNQCHAMAHRIVSSAGTYSSQFVKAGLDPQSCQTLSLKP